MERSISNFQIVVRLTVVLLSGVYSRSSVHSEQDPNGKNEFVINLSEERRPWTTSKRIRKHHHVKTRSKPAIGAPASVSASNPKQLTRMTQVIRSGCGHFSHVPYGSYDPRASVAIILAFKGSGNTDREKQTRAQVTH